ncbi:MAG: hypothetical protein EXQ55_02465 [Acidobacteria bacterium]|nr:hypothetical protein [Acidobacteriota bacterium]
MHPWGLGIGDWGFGIRDEIRDAFQTNPQSQIPSVRVRGQGGDARVRALALAAPHSTGGGQRDDGRGN